MWKWNFVWRTSKSLPKFWKKYNATTSENLKLSTYYLYISLGSDMNIHVIFRLLEKDVSFNIINIGFEFFITVFASRKLFLLIYFTVECFSKALQIKISISWSLIILLLERGFLVFSGGIKWEQWPEMG